MELEQLERKVSMLQACVRGFLVRRHFQSLRAEYEAIVREIDGDLGTLQWTEGWIPTPRFPPQKAKFPWILQAGERTNPKRAEPTCCLCKKPEKEVICEKTTLKVSRENSTLEGRLPHTDARPQGQSGKPHLDGSADWQWMKKPETAGPGLPHSQMELQELRSHLAMELLWLQQAINSRKEYLILKQTLRSPEAGQTRDKASRCPDQDGQVCESPTKDQSSSNRATGETDQTNDAYWGFRSKPCKSPERLGSTDKNTIGSKYRDPGQRRAGPQLSTPSENLVKKPGHGKQSLGGMFQQVRNSLEDQIPKIPCSGKARTQSHIIHEDPHFKDTFPGAPSQKEPDCQRVRPQELDLSEDCIFWEGPLEGLPEHHDLDLWGTKAPKGQTLSGQSSGDRITNMASHEEWKNGREAPWSLSPPEKQISAA